MSRLFEEQKRNWPLLNKNFSALKDVKTKSFFINGNEIIAQFNPHRMVSTAAKVDRESIKNRKSFLKLENLPEEQKLVSIANRYFILANPFPIFQEHFTIPTIAQIPQMLNSTTKIYLELTKNFEGRYSALYNGAKCGASAPDHFHFQAGTISSTPIETEINNCKIGQGEKIASYSQTQLFSVKDGLRRYYLIKSQNSVESVDMLKILMDSLGEVLNTDEEPKINLFSFYKNGFNICVFPRQKHRPSYYFLDEPERFLISPAVVDLAGILIVPRERDFERLNATIIKNIFDEVMINEEIFDEVNSVLSKLKSN